MSDAFTPHVRALLDDLEPPPLSADFADRLVARAEATPALPPLPPLRKPGLRRRFAQAVAVAGLVGAAAAAAVVPTDTWREIPVIGNIVEWIDPVEEDPARPPARLEPEAVVPTFAMPVAPQPAPRPEPETRPAAEPMQAPPVEARAAVPAPRAEAVPLATPPEPVERPREPLPPPVRELPVAERPAPTATREAAATVVERPAELAPERIRPADTAETRQQIRERTTATRERAAQREGAERRDRRTSRAN
jgi:hypothetical protein